MDGCSIKSEYIYIADDEEGKRDRVNEEER